MNAHDLQALLQRSQPPVLLNVLPEDTFQAARIPGSRNACIYEIAFLEKATEAVPDKSTPVITYGGGGLEARVAADRLAEAGYASTSAFEGGLPEWSAAGFPLEGPGLAPISPAISGTFRVNTTDSLIRWTGRNLFNHHSGTVRLLHGEIQIASDRLISATFEADLRSIACEDIPDAGLRATLIRHLLHSDFFDAENHPTASFVATSAAPIPSATPGLPNVHLAGALTIRGTTHPLAFDALVAASPDASRLTGQAQFEVDRTQFGSIYGSGRFFRFLGQHVVNDHFHLHLKIHADRV